MSKKTDIINLAAEFGGYDFNIFLSATDSIGSLTLDVKSQDIVDIKFFKGLENQVNTWANSSPYETWETYTFPDTPDGWTQAKLVFREAALKELARV